MPGSCRLVLSLWLILLGGAGCATYRAGHPYMFSEQLPVACRAACDRLARTPTRYVLVIRTGTQSAALYEHERFLQSFACSTSKHGQGQQLNSNCTPLGLHQIAEKIGDGEPAGTVFKSRQIVGHTSDPKFAHAAITTRILWLDGLEPGHNRGGEVDSHSRYIYIHGTSDQASIGRPASSGCTHFADPDLVALFDLLPAGTMVWIEE